MSQMYFQAACQWEPGVKALVAWDQDAAKLRAARAGNGPLAGWPVAVKDICDVAGMPTRCGVSFTATTPAAKNAAIVDRLEAAGAYVFAKTATTPFAYIDPSPTRNPWNLKHTPGGSSSGSAAAVACGMARLALGTQTVGSVIRPASYCGVVGFKPTFDCLPIQGVFALSPSVDTVGLFSANVDDMQQAFCALVDQPPLPQPTCPLRIAVIADLLCAPCAPSMLQAVDAVARRLLDAGHQVRGMALPKSCRKAYTHHMTLNASEAAKVHRDLFGEHGHEYPPRLGQLIIRGQEFDAQSLQPIHTHREETAAIFDQMLITYDLLLLPAAPDPAPAGLDSTGDPRMNLLATYTGLPALTLPASVTDKRLPLGVQLIARRKADQSLLAAARMIEHLLDFHQRPMRADDRVEPRA